MFANWELSDAYNANGDSLDLARADQEPEEEDE